MNTPLMMGFWKQRASSPLRLVLLAFMFGVPLLPALAMPQVGLGPLGDMTAIVLIVVAGAIGQDVSSGVLQLLFARPIRRSEYVTSRWLAAAVAATLVGLLQVAVAGSILMLRGAPPTPVSLMLFAGERVLASFGLCAVLILFSSLVNGIGDVGLYVLGVVTAGIAGSAGNALRSPAVARAAEEVSRFLTPSVRLGFLAGDGRFPWFEVVSFLSTVTLCLALAIVAVNRKELSYASG